MTWMRSVNTALGRATGYRLEKTDAGRPQRRAARPRVAPQAGERLLVAPAFILCSVRSGSTLLRVLLDSHSEIHAPHELHLRAVRVRLRTRYARRSLREIGLDRRAVEHLTWDRLLHRELASSGKRVLVNKTPNDVFIADRLRECWPDARFIFLLRHPLAMVRSRQAARPQDSDERNVRMIARYANAVERARQSHPGLTIRYEDLAADPAAVTRELCAFLGVEWEPGMLEYGSREHGRYRPGLGDWTEKIRSGRVQPPAPPPSGAIPPELAPVSAAWGYAAAPRG